MDERPEVEREDEREQPEAPAAPDAPVPEEAPGDKLHGDPADDLPGPPGD
jgi:hypothetical protein